MSVSLLEVIEAAGYNLETVEDADWLLSRQYEFNELIEQAYEIVQAEEERQFAADEKLIEENEND